MRRFISVSLALSLLLFFSTAEAVVYKPSPRCTNHASTVAAGCTGKILASIGTTKKAIVRFEHSTNSTNTTYTVAGNADWSAYTNVTFDVEPGALVSHSTYTMSIPNPVATHLPWLTGTGIVSLSRVTVIPTIWFGVGTSSLPAQQAVDSAPTTGATILFTEPTYTLSSGTYGIKIDKSFLTFKTDNHTIIVPSGANSQTLVFGVGVDSVANTFVQVHDIVFDGLALAGTAVGYTYTISEAHVGIYILNPTLPCAVTAPSYGIKVLNCHFSGFTEGIYGRTGNNIEVAGSYFTGMMTNPAVGHGSSICIESPIYLDIHDNTFISAATDRHAIYISGNATTIGYSGKYVNVHANYIDWSNCDKTVNPFTYAISNRAHTDSSYTNNTIIGSGIGAMSFTTGETIGGTPTKDGDNANILIRHNRIAGIRNPAGLPGGHEGAAISFGDGSAWSGVNYGITIIGNDISESAASNADGGILFVGENSYIADNFIHMLGSTSDAIRLQGPSTQVRIGPNFLNGGGTARTGIALYGGTISYIDIDKQVSWGFVDGTYKLVNASTLSSIKYIAPLRFSVAANGTGTVVAVEDAVSTATSATENIASIVTDTVGCLITFKGHYPLGANPIVAISDSQGNVDRIRFVHSFPSALSVKIGVKKVSTNAYEPLAANADNFVVTVTP
jgi:hypothetical protein